MYAIMYNLNMNKVDTTRLRDLIEKRGFTSAHVAKTSFIKVNSLHQILCGQYKPSIRVLNYLAITLGTNVDYLTGKSDDPSPNKESVA
jgi:transcriptional regulator with XRE-family HTH domain